MKSWNCEKVVKLWESREIVKKMWIREILRRNSYKSREIVRKSWIREKDVNSWESCEIMRNHEIMKSWNLDIRINVHPLFVYLVFTTFCIHYAGMSPRQETFHSTPLKLSHDGTTHPSISNPRQQDMVAVERTKKGVGGELSRVVGWPNLVSTEEV